MTADNFTRVPESFPPQAAWPVPHELQQQPSRVSGAAQQVETQNGLHCVYVAIAVAERAVIDAAMEWHVSDPYLTNSKKLRLRLAKLSALLAAREPKP